MRLIYKIVPAELWKNSVAEGQFSGAPVDIEDGFIHFSAAHQLRETARKHFSGQSNLFLVTLDCTRFGPELVWEPSRGGDLFPHLYAPLDPALAQAVTPLARDAGGALVFGEDIP